MGFFDEIKRLAQPYGNEGEEEFDEEVTDGVEEETKERPRKAARETSSYDDYSYSSAAATEKRVHDNVVSISSGTKLQVVVVNPSTFDQVSAIADHLKERRTVVLNLEKANKDIARRMVDFLSGAAYISEGTLRKVAAATYVITPYNVDIIGELMDELESSGMRF